MKRIVLLATLVVALTAVDATAGPIQRLIQRIRGNRVKAHNTYPGGQAQYEQVQQQGLASPLAGYQFAGTMPDGTPYYTEIQGSSGAVQSGVNDYSFGSIEQQLLDLCNQYRARAGQPPVYLDQALIRAAQSQTSWMASTGQFRHTGQYAGFGGATEIIAKGQRSPAEAMQSWYNSPGHRAAMLGNYRRVGFASYNDLWSGVFGY